MLKRVLLLQILFFCSFHLNAQVKSNIKLGIEPGFLLVTDSEKLGIFLNVEPKLKVTKNAFIGVRVTVVFNPQKIKIHNTLQYYTNDEFDNGGLSFVPTFDHYFKEDYFKGKFFTPYLGLGIGYYALARYLDIMSLNSGDDFVAIIDRKLGFLFRGGIESNNLRIGLEYNFIPKSDIEEPNGQTIGTVDNSYVGLSIGFILGGG